MGEIQGFQAFQLTPEDNAVLKQTDAEYTLLSWDFIKAVIAEGDLAKLTRLPSQLVAYQKWSMQTKEEYGSTVNFLLQKRLYWQSIPSEDPDAPPRFVAKSATPFAERSDYRILINDWPYGLEPGIKHICVWLKTPLPVDNVKGALTAEGFAMVDDFVKETFEKGLGLEGMDKVIWFKNYFATQSIRVVDHVHILLRDVDNSLVDPILEKPPF